MAMCIYNNCSSVQKPFSSLAFFALPKDYRRRLWIENSGNPELASLSDSARRVVCQKHFSPNSLRIQFHRTILSRDAIPERWDAGIHSNSIVNDDCVEPIEIEENYDNNCKDEIIRIDEYDDGDENDDLKQDDDWQINYESHLTSQTEGIEFVEIFNDETSQIVDDCSVDNTLNNVIELSHINDERIVLLEERLPNQFPSCSHEVEIETANSDKMKTIGVVDIASDELANQRPDKPPQEMAENEDIQCDGTASDVTVSSTSKSNENTSESNHITNEEDKYFALALVGILQRISPQKKAFAKVNILRYLTELEYGVEARIN